MLRRVARALPLFALVALGTSLPAQAAPLGTPTASVGLSSNSPTTNATLMATANATPAGTYSYTFTWTRQVGAGAPTTVQTTTNSTGTDSLNLSLAGRGDKGDIITVSVTATDANGTSTPVTASATVANSLPTMKPIALSTWAGRNFLGRPELSDDDATDFVFVANVANAGAVGSISGATVTQDNTDGLYLYNARPSTGTDNFIFTISDGTTTVNQTAQISVSAAPTAGTNLYTALGASDVQGYGASDYNLALTSFSPANAYAPRVANQLTGVRAPLVLSRRAINGLTLSGANRAINGQSNLTLALADAAPFYSVWYGPNDVLRELLPMLLSNNGSNTNSAATLDALVTNYLSNWKPGYTALRNALVAASPNGRFAAITVPDLGPGLTAAVTPTFGLTPTQQTNLASAINSACRQMSSHILATFPRSVDVQNQTDLTAGDAALVFNPNTDLFVDGFHPNDSGYAKIATRLFRQLVPPALSIVSVSNPEGSGGTPQPLRFTVSLSRPNNIPVSVNYATADGSATAGSDYTATSGTLTIPAGQTSATLAVPIIGDTIREADETFSLNLTAPSEASFPNGGATLSATGTILNDDATPVLTVNGVTLAEGNAGPTTFNFAVSLSAPSGSAITVDYTTADGSATAGSDYTAATGTLTIPAGATSATVPVLVNGDAVVEADETLTLTLSNPSGAGFNGGAATTSATGTIVNDDPAPAAAATDVSGQFTLYKSGLTRNRTTGRYLMSLVLQNNGATLSGPLYLAIDGLGSGLSLYNPDGFTNRATPAGSPYRTLVLPGATPGTFAAGTAVNLVIEIVNPANSALTFTTRTLQGPGTP